MLIDKRFYENAIDKGIDGEHFYEVVVSVKLGPGDGQPIYITLDPDKFLAMLQPGQQFYAQLRHNVLFVN